MRIEHYFPDIDDPRILHAALIDFKHEYDETASSIDEMKEYRTKNGACHAVVLKAVCRTSSREFIDKKIYFNC